MGEVAGITVPTAQGFGSKFLHWGVPILAGVGGFFLGDIWGVSALLDPWIGPILDAGNIPFESRLDYRALAAAGVYGISAGVIGALTHRFLPGGSFMRAIGKTVAFYLGGTTVRLVLSGIAPKAIGTGGSILLPAIVR